MKYMHCLVPGKQGSGKATSSPLVYISADYIIYRQSLVKTPIKCDV